MARAARRKFRIGEIPITSNASISLRTRITPSSAVMAVTERTIMTPPVMRGAISRSTTTVTIRPRLSAPEREPIPPMPSTMANGEVDLQQDLAPKIPLAEIALCPDDLDGQIEQPHQKEGIAKEADKNSPEAIYDTQQFCS